MNARFGVDSGVAGRKGRTASTIEHLCSIAIPTVASCVLRDVNRRQHPAGSKSLGDGEVSQMISYSVASEPHH
jgi:hypothetical protein